MISIADCIAMCGLSEEEVLAIAEHEHVPEVVATCIAKSLLEQHDGLAKVRDIIRDDVIDAVKARDYTHAREMLGVMRHFLEEHPEVRP